VGDASDGGSSPPPRRDAVEFAFAPTPPAPPAPARPPTDHGSASPPTLFSFFSPDIAAPTTTAGAAPAPPHERQTVEEDEADFDGVIEELEAIAVRFLGQDGPSVTEPIIYCEHSVPALRTAITALRTVEVTGHSPESVSEMTRTMLRAVADRLSAL
jgi:hypothetical protein